MMALQFAVVLAAIFFGARIGGIGIGFAGGLGVLVLAALGVTPGAMPLDVISIIMSVIVAIAAMQIAGGMDYLVDLADRILRKNPKHLTFLAPIITFLMTMMAGTGHTAFSTMPVITEVAKENNIRPSRPLSIAVVASQIAITASPISAAVVFMASLLESEGTGVDYIQLLAVAIPSTFLAVMCTAAIMIAFDKIRGNSALDTHPEYQRRMAAGTVTVAAKEQRVLKPGAKRSVLIFLIGLVAVMTYATLISDKVGLIAEPVMPRDAAIISIMLSIAAIIVLVCKVPTADILGASTFKSGMSAAICVLGVAWLGTTFVHAHEEAIMASASDLLNGFPWMLAVVLALASALLYSQAATTKALMPTALLIGVGPAAAVAAFPAVSALFILPTYPTLLAAVEMDDTGTTQIGKYVFNHPFLVPGVINIALAVGFGFLFSSFLI
ncbi:anaerobic C4-dicarboxylate transporter [Cellulomonas sp. zg-Y338]|uniref:C4-dicarboxylate transporter DcuA n=3 Tax=Cellulomonas chengniuliangii TaxID=2968084 RepID=A0ABY5L3J8_9CELL|nr:anaerobic C4-dicarboxylate transporter [Cellulomonas chengniuliangii]MCC2317439.1 anaerobic C4-dicarboxylate transporter [Cellulomonas chengniuliangii]UUI76949.1 anaerobic C4-dicarboxylate transporter [Cellulomonas chengniuliangii]